MTIRKFGGTLTGLKRVVMLTGFLGAAALAFIIGFSGNNVPQQPLPTSVSQGWGNEALQAAYDSAVRMSPIAMANACGLGASSCFKCHNGKRAVAPVNDRKLAPWHPDHKSTNYSCAGCHQGNPRLMKKEISHKNMLADPRKSPEVACGKCHQGGEGAKRNEQYRSIAAGGK